MMGVLRGVIMRSEARREPLITSSYWGRKGRSSWVKRNGFSDRKFLFHLACRIWPRGRRIRYVLGNDLRWEGIATRGDTLEAQNHRCSMSISGGLSSGGSLRVLYCLSSSDS